MKAARFDYHCAASVADACQALASHEDARLIAGGQTLVPMMAMRLARPSLLVDIVRLSELRTIEAQAGELVAGACVRQAQAERDPLVRVHAPLLARALPFVGHAPTRNRGTLGGSIANADPAAEIPLVLVTLGGSVDVRQGDVSAQVAASDLFEGPMMTSLAPTACITAVRFPVWDHPRIGTGFLEVSARQSDYAYVCAAAQVALDEDGTVLRCALGIGGATAVPTRLSAVVQALTGRRVTLELVREALRPAIAALDIMVDAHASRDYRRRVALRFAEQALMAACADATARPAGAGA